MADRPLSPAIRLGLGGPLPHLLADRTRVSRVPDRSFYPKAYGVLADVSTCCPPVLDKSSRVTHPSATKTILKQAPLWSSFDLHVLGTPPAFVLSQDQTLRLIPDVSLSLTFFLTGSRRPGILFFSGSRVFALLRSRFRCRLKDHTPSPFLSASPRLNRISMYVAFAFSLFFLSWCLPRRRGLKKPHSATQREVVYYAVRLSSSIF